MGKTGWIYLLDRRNGKPILGIPERKVPQSREQHTWPTQPIPKGQPFAMQCATKDVWSKWKAPDGKPVKVGVPLHAVQREAVHGVRTPAARWRRLAAVELQLADRLHVRLLEGQLGCLEGTARSRRPAS